METRAHYVAVGAFVLTTWILGMRPAAVPQAGVTIVIAMDTSLSLQATDVEPSRFDAAKTAASRFVDGIPRKIRVGLVSFAGTARVVVPPTTDRVSVRNGIANLSSNERTAIGEAVFASLESISSSRTRRRQEHRPARIVLISDGETTAGRPDDDAARAAVEAGVPVSTIALGTETGFVVVGGRTVSVPVNREALRCFAASTKGRYYPAGTRRELERAFDELAKFLAFRNGRQGVTVRVLAVALLLASILGGLVWILVGPRPGRPATYPPATPAPTGTEPEHGDPSP